jgi:hypothetical protein
MNELKKPFESRDLTALFDRGKNPFESHDLKSRFDQVVDPRATSNGTVMHIGGERRYHSRRTTADRRTDIRFEIDKEGRRTGRGRRFDDEEDISL